MNPRTRRLFARLTLVSLVITQTLQSGQAAITDLSATPLANSTTSVVRPNIMYVLDNSGSMAWDFTPDYVNDSESPTAHTWGMCWGTTGTTTGTRTSGGISSCQNGSGGSPKDSDQSSCCNSYDDMPWATAAINYQYYDPAIRYTPPIKADGTSYPNSTSTAAKTDGFSTTSSTVNLTTSWVHQVWCTTSTAAPTAANPTASGLCVENQDTSAGVLYPDATHVFLKNYSAAPYYFQMSPREYCTDSTGTNCVVSPTSTTVSGVVFNVPSNFRWCASYSTSTHTFSGCQAHRDQSHYIPNYLGGWVQTGSLGSYASSSLQIKNSLVDGQSITGITIGGVEVLGTTITADSSSTTNTVARDVCAAIHASSAGSGYTCLTAPTSDTVVITSASVGTAANGQQVLVAGPPDTSPVYSEGRIVITNPTTSGFKINGITINSNNLISRTITAGTDAGAVAKDVCDAINAGPNTAFYVARTPNNSGTAWGSCTADSTAEVGVQRKIADSVDNGMPIVITGPATATQYTGSLTIVPTAGQTRIDDVRVGGTSILSSKPLTYTDGNASDAIALDIASKITGASGCSALVTGSVIDFTGGGACTGALTTAATPTAATAVLTVSSTGHTNGADLGGIQISTAGSSPVTTNLVGHLSSTQLSNGASVSANATTIKNAIGSGFTAATPVASGSNYDITVTAPVSGNYNGQTFTFLAGTPVVAAAGTAPQWTFDITGATANGALINSINCGVSGAASTIQPSTATTGGTSAVVDRINNLAVNAATNGLSTLSANGYSFSCTSATTATPQSTCTLTGPAGVAACGASCILGKGLCVTRDASISIGAVTRPNAGSAATATWSFNITGATANSKLINSITCPAGVTNTVTTGTVGTGTPSNPDYAGTLKDAINSASNSGGGWNGTSACTSSGSTVTCGFQRNSGDTRRCTGTVTVSLSSGAQMTVAPLNPAGTVVGNASETFTGTSPNRQYTYSFRLSNVVNPNEQVTQVNCSSSSPGNAMTSTATTGNATSALVQRINNLRTALQSNDTNSYTYTCTAASNATPSSTCTVTGPDSCALLSISADASITTAGLAKTGSSAASNPTWTIPITGASADSKTINSITCTPAAGTPVTNAFNTSTKPTTGTPSTTTVESRINNLTQASGTGLQSIAQNGYSYSCTTATSSTQSSRCTVTGPVGAAECNVTDFVISSDASITTGNKVRTAPGSGNSGTVDDFAPYLSTTTPFTGGYAAQAMVTSGLASVNTGTIATTLFPMSAGSAPSPLTVLTNATGISPDILVMSGGTGPTGANSWLGVGNFKRIDLIPTTTIYSRSSNRTDCAGGTCSYSEEIQNFANWYSYYKTRMNMMKTTSTLAFNALDNKYRVGFDDICNCASGTCSTSVKTPVGQFIDSGGETPNQRTNWWNQLVGSTPSCSTPLRAETAKIGRYYAGKLTSDPMQYSCQQNFLLLVTDGYWNESDSSAIKTVDGSDIDNRDNDLSTAPKPYYDGQQASTTCPTVGGTRSSASSCRTLADIAHYYYNTDLRTSTFGNATNSSTSQDVSLNNVPITPDDANSAQHMSFFGMALGVDGTLEYRADYDTAATGAYHDILTGSRNWPAVANLDPTGIDDLWHAAVNGHGKYFSARNPATVTAGLVSALSKMSARVGSASAAATSNLEPVAGDNFAFLPTYTTVEWVGDLQERTIDPDTGRVSSDSNCGVTGSGCVWSAQDLLDNQTWSARQIYVAPISGATGDPLRLFTYDRLTATEQGYFLPSTLSQFPALFVSNPADITATNLVDFLRGNRGLEQDGDIAHPQIWRRRSHVLGDIVDTRPVFVKAPQFSYGDAGYATFKTSSTAAARKPVVYVSANDGMLHAFNAYTSYVTVQGARINPGEEMWAFIPSAVMPAIKTLGDFRYAHQYFVDGLITVGDVNFGGSDSDWHTILVGGLGGGGKSLYALDVTDPLNPTYLWEFTDATRLGHTYGAPSINKLPNGEWVVLFASGHNNADGQGYLFAVDVKTGALKSGFPMATGTGSALSPSGLSKINVWADDPIRSNMAQYVYGGDLNGDLWRFDLDPDNTFGSNHTGVDVFQLAHLTDDSNNPQPITTSPEMTKLDSGTRVILVGTGRYLGLSDLANTQTQSFYMMKDLLTPTQSTWNPRVDNVTSGGATISAFVQRKLISLKDDGTAITQQMIKIDSAGNIVYDASHVPVMETVEARMVCSGPSSYVSHTTNTCAGETGGTLDLSTQAGWYVDLPDTGERENVDPLLFYGTVVFPTNVPASSACTSGGHSFLNAVDYKSGLGLTPIVSAKFWSALIVGISPLITSRGTSISVQLSSGTNVTVDVQTGSQTFSNRRSLWREFEIYR